MALQLQFKPRKHGDLLDNATAFIFQEEIMSDHEKRIATPDRLEEIVRYLKAG